MRHPSLMSALAEIERIRSVKDSLSEGISGLQLLISPNLSDLERDEAIRCLKILRDFCQSFLASVNEASLSERRENDVSWSARKIFGDIALYGGIISAFNGEERESRYKDISEIQKLTSSELDRNNIAQAVAKQYLNILEELYKLAESRIMAREQIAERIILGGNTIP
ncbi:MAG: hypothetical protein ABSG74_01495 [Candidatus Bathyarchaeia archaeon]